MIYFDAAATTFRKPPDVARAVQQAMAHCASVGRGGYREAMAAAETVYRCRARCAALFDCVPEQVVFTANATHGLNVAIKSLVRPGARVVVSGFEHNAVMRPLTALGAQTIYAQRKPLYARLADAMIDNNGTPEAAAAQILEVLGCSC